MRTADQPQIKGSRSRAIRVAVVSVAVLGCTHKRPAPASPQTPGPAGEANFGSCSECPPDRPGASPIIAAVERYAGLELSSEYGFVVHADGRLEYFGAAYVRKTGYCTVQLSRQELDQIRAALRAADLEHSDDEEAQVIDSPGAAISTPLPDGGFVQRGAAELGSLDLYPGNYLDATGGRLGRLARQLEGIAPVPAWVGDPFGVQASPRQFGIARCLPIPKAWEKWFPVMNPPSSSDEKSSSQGAPQETESR